MYFFIVGRYAPSTRSKGGDDTDRGTQQGGVNILKINTVTVIGGNGTMGANISGIFASFGGAKVYMVVRNLDSARKAFETAVVSVKAESIGSNLIPVSYDELSECIKKSDLIIESVIEDICIKKSVYQKVNEYIPPNAIIATGTSGLSVDVLAEQLDEDKRKRFFGVHFFNPPYNMTLCEFIPSKYSDRQVALELKDYLRFNLLRNVVEVKNTAAFMGNRIGFMFINLALQFAEKYKYSGGIDYIDSIMGGFTGRAMPPLGTSDFVGLDVHKAIVDNIYNNINDYEHESFVIPEFVQSMINENHLGRKSGIGLYKLVYHGDNSKEVYVYDIETNMYRPKRKYSFPFAEHMIAYLRNGDYAKAFSSLISNKSPEARICVELLVRYVLYGIFTSKTIGEDIHSADKVMASGFNWIPPLCVYNVLNANGEFEKISKELLPPNILNNLKLDDVLSDLPLSNYDYRPFFKAKG